MKQMNLSMFTNGKIRWCTNAASWYEKLDTHYIILPTPRRIRVAAVAAASSVARAPSYRRVTSQMNLVSIPTSCLSNIHYVRYYRARVLKLDLCHVSLSNPISSHGLVKARKGTMPYFPLDWWLINYVSSISEYSKSNHLS